MNDKKIHGVFKITPITPIHISNGEKYQIFEYYIDDNKTFYLKDIMKFFQDKYEDYETESKIEDDLSFRPGPEYIRYTLPVFADPEKAKKSTSIAQPKSPTESTKKLSLGKRKNDPEIAKIMKQADKKLQKSDTLSTPSTQSASVNQPTREVFSFIKDPFGQPFIPGSSLKGCIRTAITCYILEISNDPQIHNRNLKEEVLNKVFEACSKDRREKLQDVLLEYMVPNNDAKYDLFRSLVIRDSSPFHFINSENNLPTLKNFAVCQIQITKKESNKLTFQGGMLLAECLIPCDPVEVPFYIDRLTLEELVKLKHSTKLPGMEKLNSILSNPDKFKNTLLNFSKKLIKSQEDFYTSSGETNPLQLDFQEQKREMKDYFNLVLVPDI